MLISDLEHLNSFSSSILRELSGGSSEPATPLTTSLILPVTDISNGQTVSSNYSSTVTSVSSDGTQSATASSSVDLLQINN